MFYTAQLQEHEERVKCMKGLISHYTLYSSTNLYHYEMFQQLK